MGAFILAGFVLTIVVLGVVSGRKLAYFMLLVGGIPITIFMPGLKVLESLGSINPQAALLFSMVMGTLLALMLRLDTVVKELINNIWLTAFLLFAVGSLAWAGDFVYGVRMVVKLSAPFLFLILFMAYMREPEEFRRAEKALFIVCGIVLGLALLNEFTGGSIWRDSGLKMVRSDKVGIYAPFMSPANFSFLIGTGAILALANFFVERKIRYLLLYVVFAVIVFWAFTRISMAALVLATAICIWMLSRSMVVKFAFPIVIIVGFFLSFFLIDSFRDRMFMDSSISLESLANDPEKLQSGMYLSGRSALWEAARTQFFDPSPGVGAGAGSVDRWLDTNVHSRLHSEYLRLACDLGVVGLVLYVAGLLAFFTRLARVRRNAKDPLVTKYAVSAIAGLSFYATTLATDNSLNYVTEFGMYVYFLLALAFAAARWESWAEPPMPGVAGSDELTQVR